MNLESPFDQAAALLPFELRQLALALPRAERVVAEEVCLRAGQPVCLTLPEGEAVLPRSPILSEQTLRTVLEIATRASAHTALEQVRRGYVTVAGGHRLGLCGTAAVRDGRVCNLRRLSSVNIRIAREIKGAAEEPVRQLRQGGEMPSVLILAPPGGGKTTLLRDLIRCLSDGVGG
ncbi:MAG: stage III sporulation protein AB, partial [Oscillospiraceae bacterium]|nr:stage III sporulation protein AB [Oscillospiraceae bacterium]